jgi:hypothetical protein
MDEDVEWCLVEALRTARLLVAAGHPLSPELVDFVAELEMRDWSSTLAEFAALEGHEVD